MDDMEAEYHLRPLRTHAEFEACVALQRLTWGPEYTDVVPASLLKASQHVGGVVAGAFTPAGELTGFVFGLTGFREGRPAHWSHMLAVRPDLRNHGLGQRLKRYQASCLRDSGVEEIRWTFDPLVARNAHLNLCRLGVRVEEYVPDMYADTGSGLHSFGTDRFIVSWRFCAEPGDDEPEGQDGQTNAPLHATCFAIPPCSSDAAPPPLDTPLPDALEVSIPIPTDVEALSRTHREATITWRRVTRRAFLHYQERGYTIVGFRRSHEGPRYVIRRGGDK